MRFWRSDFHLWFVLLCSGALCLSAIAQEPEAVSASVSAQHPKPVTPVRPVIRILVQSSPLAGFQYHDAVAVWSEMKEGDALQLRREPDNPHDARAIRVEWRGRMLGYLPRAENRVVAAAIDRQEGRIEARIARLREHANPWQRVQVDVFVVL